MMNKILAVVAGIITGLIVVFLGEMVTHILFPPPPGIDFTNQEAVMKMISELPASAFIVLMAIWGISAFVGGLITGLIAKESWKTLSLITGGLLLVGAILNMFMVPHPIWVNVITVIMYLPLAYLGGKMVNKKEA